MKYNSIALIPLRGGSKSIPKKNIKILNNKPLCAWVLGAAFESKVFDEIFVSTDSEEILEVVENLKLNIKVLDRPPELATDNASTESVILDLMKKIDFEIITTIQATSPLTLASDFISAFKKFENDKLDSLLTGNLVKKFFWTLEGKPLNYDPLERPRRQDFQGTIIENGAFYITKRSILEKYQCRLGGKIGIHEMTNDSLIDIDEPEDWLEVEKLILKRSNKLFNEKLQKIKLLAIDVDGTLTDSGMYYSKEGEILKKFNTKDGKGIELARNIGIKVAFITGEDTEIVRVRAEKLKIEYLFMGIHDKMSILNKISQELNISTENIAYVGDDINDLECIKNVGFSACPYDAVSIIKNYSNYICHSSGGNGAIREVCDLIISSVEK